MSREKLRKKKKENWILFFLLFVDFYLIFFLYHRCEKMCNESEIEERKDGLDIFVYWVRFLAGLFDRG